MTRGFCCARTIEEMTRGFFIFVGTWKISRVDFAGRERYRTRMSDKKTLLAILVARENDCTRFWLDKAHGSDFMTTIGNACATRRL